MYFMKNRLAGNFALFLTALIWGLGFVAQRAGMEFIGPFTFNAIRSFLGALSLVPLILWVKYSKPDLRTEKRKYVRACGGCSYGSLHNGSYAPDPPHQRARKPFSTAESHTTD